MASQHIAGKYKSAAGMILVGLGLFILYKSLGCEIAGAQRSLCVNDCDGLGTVPALVLMSGRVLHGFAGNRLGFLFGGLRQMAVIFWPLLLTRVGMVMAQEPRTDNANRVAENSYGLVDLHSAHSSSK